MSALVDRSVAVTIGGLVAAGTFLAACATVTHGRGAGASVTKPAGAPTTPAASAAEPTPSTTPEVSAPANSAAASHRVEPDSSVHGEVIILGKGWAFAERRQHAACHGSGRYSDVRENTAVGFTDGRGRPIGTGYLLDGRAHFGKQGRCVLDFLISVPSRKSYQIAIGGRAAQKYPAREIQHGRVQLEIGKPASRPLHPPPPMITLRVTGNGSHALVTYAEDSDIRQNTDAALPWSTQVDTFGSFYQVSAQDDDGTSITCEILGPGGAVIDTNTSTGPYAIASCSSSY